jgi:ankyrin repeat protein
MSDPQSGSPPAPLPLPDKPSLEWLRKHAKQRLAALREPAPNTQLAEAQFAVAREYGFPSWRALKAHVESLSIEGQLFDAAREGHIDRLARLLDRHPDKLAARATPYEWSLLHAAAARGHLAAVDLLLNRGLDPNTRERGDDTYAMHWAAAAGHLEVVRRLAAAGGDVVGHGDDHGLEVIGWATCWERPHEDVAAFLVSRGAHHHIFSAIAMNLADEVRRLVAADPSVVHTRMSRNEVHQLPLQFAIRKRRRDMVALLLELGADPLAVDGEGHNAAAYAMDPDTDRAVMARIKEMGIAEARSAERGLRSPRNGPMDLMAALALDDWTTAALLVQETPALLDPDGGVLHLMTKRNASEAVEWLLARGADPNGRWAHWDAIVTPLHLAVLAGHVEVATRLLASGADPTVCDSKHDGDAIGWARFFGRDDLVALLETYRNGERTSG